eukprot:Phypoly_transcript_11955.p1 GENE.Phypoly_transcript_11955~~Phypoly_transcript_11955.p1  ORF type:complete len:127 (+),score=0.25 Phypoly_transcript_11955:312-692(+)
MRAIAKASGFSHFIVVPVLPILKSEHPLIPIETYMTWKNDTGQPFDPWLRRYHYFFYFDFFGSLLTRHIQMGGKVLKAAPRSQFFIGTIQKIWRICSSRSLRYLPSPSPLPAFCYLFILTDRCRYV